MLPMSDEMAGFVADYDRRISGNLARRMYGDSGFYNIGYWAGIAARTVAGLPAACEALVRKMASQDSAEDRDRCETLLDVGCGLGAGTVLLARLHRNAAIHGINLSERQLQAARLRCPEGRFRVMDATRLDYPDASFDRLFCVEAMFQFQPRAKFLAEAGRVLRPGGRLMVADALYDCGVGLHFPACNVGTDPRLFSELARNTGLRVRSTEDITEHSLVPFLQIVRDISDGAWGELIERSVSSYHLVVFERP